MYPQELERWRQAATQTLANPEEARASSQQVRQDRRRIQELERELRRKDRALAETTAPAGAVKKSRGDLQQDQGRGRMAILEDRQVLTARHAGRLAHGMALRLLAMTPAMSRRRALRRAP
ncbi:MAG TPA: hypothetical protein VIG66_03710 [Noviherbaspirillum sp.]